MQVIVFGVLLVVLAGAYLAVLPHIIKYRLTDRALDVYYVGLRSVHIPYGDIQQITLVPSGLWRREMAQPINREMLGRSFSTCRLGTRMWGPCVSVITKKNFKIVFNQLLLTPEDPEKFIAELKARCRL